MKRGFHVENYPNTSEILMNAIAKAKYRVLLDPRNPYTTNLNPKPYQTVRKPAWNSSGLLYEPERGLIRKTL